MLFALAWRVPRLLATLVAVYSFAGASFASAQTIAELRLTPSLPPGPLDTFSQDNPMNRGRFIHRLLWQLVGVEQVPNDAVIQEVRVQRISSGTFGPGTIPASFRPALSVGGVTFLQVTTGAMGEPADSDPLEIYGTDQYVTGGGAVYSNNPFTNQPWTRADLTTLYGGFWARWENLTFSPQTTQKLSLNDFTVEVVYQKLTVAGADTLWSFNGAQPAGWATTVTLTASRSATWSIVSGSDKVSLSTTSGTQVDVLSTPAGISGTLNDIVIRATSGNEDVDHELTERAPHTLQAVALPNPTSQDSTYAYMTHVRYNILDQFLQALPAGSMIPLNESWTTSVVSDYPKENWRPTNAAGTTTASPTFDDVIYGEISSRKPTPTFDPASNTAVQHWGQAWQIGSASVGLGRRVQTNTLQKMLGRALHTNIVTPP